MLYELDSRSIQKDREKGLTVEEILIGIMYEKYTMTPSEIGEVLRTTPQTIRAEYIRGNVKKSSLLI